MIDCQTRNMSGRKSYREGGVVSGPCERISMEEVRAAIFKIKTIKLQVLLGWQWI